jgi:hypothetical protein
MVKLIFISKSFYETNYTNIFESKLLVTLNAIFLYFITFSNLVLWAWPILISEYESTIIRSPILVTCNYQTNYQRTIIIHSKTSNKYFQFVWYTFRNVGFYIYILKKYKKKYKKSIFLHRTICYTCRNLFNFLSPMYTIKSKKKKGHLLARRKESCRFSWSY